MKKLLRVFSFCLIFFSSCKKTGSLPEETVAGSGPAPAQRINQSFEANGKFSSYVGFDLDMDFNYSIVGDPGLDAAGALRRGAAYIFTRPVNSNVWTQEAAIKHANAVTNDNFGFEVAIDGINAVSCTNDSLYAFRKTGSKWLQVQAFVPGNLPAEGLSVSSIDIDGDHMIVGHASRKLGSRWSVGAVYFFRWVNNAWVYQSTFTSPNAGEYDWFGIEVSMYGNYALVGARGGSDPCSGTGPDGHGGKAYVYLRSGNTWTRQATIAPPDLVKGDLFGESLDIYENIAVIGASQGGRGCSFNQVGKVYVYRRSGTTWTRDVTILSPDYMTDGNFGRAVALSKNYLAVSGGGNDGAVYFFSRFGLSFFYNSTDTNPVPTGRNFGCQLVTDSTQHYLAGQSNLGHFHFGTVY